MNKVCLIGRLTSKPELRYTGNNVANTRFTLAVNREFKKEDGEREADFINCVAWRKTAELICNYLDKGSQVAVEGGIRTGSYEKENGDKVYTTDVLVDTITFLNSKKSETKEEEQEDPFSDFGDTVSIDDNFLD